MTREATALRGRVLVTGASGLIGAEVVAHLVSGGHSVFAMVHHRDEIRRNDGSNVVGDAVRVVHGDVAEPRMGLDGTTYRQVRGETMAVVHCAAVTEFGLDRDVYQRVNVVGTAQVAEFCRRLGADVPFVHVGTAFVVGKRRGRVVEQHVTGFHPDTANFYEESKYDGELAIHRAGAAEQAVIVRPSIVAGAEQTGRIREFDNLYAAFRAATDGTVRNVPGDYAATLNLVPIDHVAQRVVAALVRADSLRGTVVHIVSRKALTLADLSTVLAEYPEFAVPRFLSGPSFAAARRGPLERRIYDSVMRHYEPYFARDIEFDTAAAARLAWRVPPGGKRYLRRVLDHALDAGFLGRRYGRQAVT